MQYMKAKTLVVTGFLSVLSTAAFAENYGRNYDYGNDYHYNDTGSHDRKKKNTQKQKNYKRKSDREYTSTPSGLRKGRVNSKHRITKTVGDKSIHLITSSSSKLPLLTDEAGRTLYIFDNDKSGLSNCQADCSESWPPYLVKDNEEIRENFSVIERSDGSRQWAYLGMPLYYWVADKKPGDIKGNGIAGVWHILRSNEFKKVQQQDARNEKPQAVSTNKKEDRS
ncbi:MAG: COG4315 family predicted lipoprotein [Methyloligellaceae bacterium]